VGYIPQSQSERQEMLAALGLQSSDQLFEQVPDSARAAMMPRIPGPLTEQALARHMRELGKQNRSLESLICFAGGGVYDHFIPAIVDDVVRRPEFVTPYTPYQAEASQGTLQALFQYQTMVCELTAMDAANASLYDGASGLGEAVLMAAAATGRTRALISRALSPAARRVTETYCTAATVEISQIPFDPETGQTLLQEVADALDEDVCCVALQQPNYFGTLEEMEGAAQLSHEAGALFISLVEPMSLALLNPPGAYDADIAVGEGQPLGLPPGFGGPLLGLFACKEDYLRQMPGRVVGETTDEDGQIGYCLTLQTREQHIRRYRATSNICTSQTLCAIAATVYMAALGPEGLREAAHLGVNGAHLLAETIASEVKSASLRFTGAFMNEFVLNADGPADVLISSLCDAGFLVGPALGRDYPELESCLLIAVTEQRTRDELEGLAAALRAELS